MNRDRLHEFIAEREGRGRQSIRIRGRLSLAQTMAMQGINLIIEGDYEEADSLIARAMSELRAARAGLAEVMTDLPSAKQAQPNASD